MLYCSYDQYAAAGGSMTEQSFTVLCARASRLIDGLTFGRAEPHAKACESCRSALTDAVTNIVQNNADIDSEMQNAQDTVEFNIAG